MFHFFGSGIAFPGFNGMGYFLGNLTRGKPGCNLLQRNYLNAEYQGEKYSYDLFWLHQVRQK